MKVNRLLRWQCWYRQTGGRKPDQGQKSGVTGLYVAGEELMALRSSVLYTRSHAVHVTWHKKTARKRNWGDRNWLCKVKFQFRVHFRQKGGGGRPPERHLAEPEWSWLTRATACTVRTALCTPALYPHFSTYLWLCCIIEGERREGGTVMFPRNSPSGKTGSKLVLNRSRCFI